MRGSKKKGRLAMSVQQIPRDNITRRLFFWRFFFLDYSFYLTQLAWVGRCEISRGDIESDNSERFSSNGTLPLKNSCCPF